MHTTLRDGCLKIKIKIKLKSEKKRDIKKEKREEKQQSKTVLNRKIDYSEELNPPLWGYDTKRIKPSVGGKDFLLIESTK